MYLNAGRKGQLRRVFYGQHLRSLKTQRKFTFARDERTAVVRFILITADFFRGLLYFIYFFFELERVAAQCRAVEETTAAFVRSRRVGSAFSHESYNVLASPVLFNVTVFFRYTQVRLG